MAEQVERQPRRKVIKEYQALFGRRPWEAIRDSGRFLVQVGEQYWYEYANRTPSRFTKSLQKLEARLTSEVYHGTSDDPDVLGRLNTARLELAFLQGDQETINRILESGDTMMSIVSNNWADFHQRVSGKLYFGGQSG